jgi:uncharacterized protein YciI
MKKMKFLSMVSLIISSLFFYSTDPVNAQQKNPKYDSTLAKKWGADDYGMKKYIFVLLTSGTTSGKSKFFIDSCFAGHMSNMDTMVKKGQLVIAGPFMKNDRDYRGLFILNTDDVSIAKDWLKSDPAVSSGLLLAELTVWYASAALGAYLEESDKMAKFSF